MTDTAAPADEPRSPRPEARNASVHLSCTDGEPPPPPFWRKFRNTFLQAHWLWRMVVDEGWYQRLREPRPGLCLRRRLESLLRRCLWFWPNVGAELALLENNYCKPEYYTELDPWSVDLVEEIAFRASSRSAKILDLGCNCGRHLHGLWQLGFTDLHGVDLSREAFEDMAGRFPGLPDDVTLTCALFQEFLTAAPSESYEIVYSRGIAIESVHPSFPLVSEIARIARRFVVLVLVEQADHTRFWTYEFTRAGFSKVMEVYPHEALDQHLMVFRRQTTP